MSRDQQMTPERLNVPPWNYKPKKGPINFRVLESGEVVGAGMERSLDGIARVFAEYYLPPRLDQLVVATQDNQLLLGWRTEQISQTIEFLGVHAAFEALAPHLPDLQFELAIWELSAQGVR